MTPGLGVEPKRTRESTSKVRTGCSTCKARRVKCDEARPICRRCAVGNRQCDYRTVSPTRTQRQVVTVYLPPAQSQPTYLPKDPGVDFFHQKLAAQLDGQYDTEFWSRLVVQLSHTEPSIRHAVSAVSIIHQDIESSLRHPTGYISANPKAQQDWNAALRSLATRIEAQPDSSLVPLVCCLLFTCIEFLRGNDASSLLHVENGLKILASIRPNGVTTPDSVNARPYDDINLIEEHIVPVFSRLSILCTLASSLTPPLYPANAEEDGPHADLGDSRRRLTKVIDLCVRFIYHVTAKAQESRLDVEDFLEQAKLRNRLTTWRDELDELLARMQKAGKDVQRDAVNTLLVQQKVLYIWLSICTSGGESAADTYFADFEGIIQMAEQIAEIRRETASQRLLAFDLQVLGPLFCVTLKCRHPGLRRRALELLRTTPRKEGFWDAQHAYLTARRVIEVEERHLDERGLPLETSRVCGLPLPSMESRIYNLGETSFHFDFQKFDHSIVPGPGCPGTIWIEFQMKPWGPDGDWRKHIEYIDIS
jgi:hypothetical protein